MAKSYLSLCITLLFSAHLLPAPVAAETCFGSGEQPPIESVVGGIGRMGPTEAITYYSTFADSAAGKLLIGELGKFDPEASKKFANTPKLANLFFIAIRPNTNLETGPIGAVLVAHQPDGDKRSELINTIRNFPPGLKMRYNSSASVTVKTDELEKHKTAKTAGTKLMMVILPEQGGFSVTGARQMALMAYLGFGDFEHISTCSDYVGVLKYVTAADEFSDIDLMLAKRAIADASELSISVKVK